MKRTFALSACVVAVLATLAHAQPREVQVDARWFWNADAVHAGGTIHAAIQVKLDREFHVQANQVQDEFAVPTVLTVAAPPGFVVREIVYPQPIAIAVQGFDQPLPVFESEFVIGVAMSVAEDAALGTHAVTASLEYQACNDKFCLAPAALHLSDEIKVAPADQPLSTMHGDIFAGLTFADALVVPQQSIPTAPAGPVTPAGAVPGDDCDVLTALEDFVVLGTAGGYLGADDFLAFIDAAESGTQQRNVLEGKGPLAIVLLVMVGGVLLNLTPCVLPLIPINLAIIGAGAQASSRGRGFALGGTYGLAMAAVYGALGLIVTLTAAKFGAINSTVWFNAAIAVLFVLLALAMFDLIHIDFSKYQGRFDASRLGGSGTFALAFGMGAVSALLAGACVAPVVIQVIVYAGDQYARGTTMALALPFFLGLGMALPWPFAGAGLSMLPKPGKWMVRVKQAMGVFILAFAAYYAYGAWEIYNSSRGDPEAVKDAMRDNLAQGWNASICHGLATAKAQNKLVLIDMWATWCKNCFAMDKTTFKDPSVVRRLDDYVKIKFQTQVLGASPNREMLERFEQIGLPAYAILRPRTAMAADSRR